MAAQARQYDKSISYSSRQSDDKYMSSKNHLLKSSSPYHSKSNSNHSSPVNRKRSHDSPYNMKYSNSPYESGRKRDRCNDSSSKSFNEETQVECDWSQHISSSGKVYYYNKKQYESQWEVPKEWTDRGKKDKDRSFTLSSSASKDNRTNKNPIDYKNNTDYRDSIRDYKNSRDNNDYRDSKDPSRYKDSRDFRNRDSKTRKLEMRRDSYDSRDSPRNNRDYRDCNNRENKYDGIYRSPHSTYNRRNSRYSSSNSIKTYGQSTPSSNTTSNRSHQLSPNSSNGSGIVQDISPPGTPTTDDVLTLNNTAPVSSLFTPSPILNSSVLSTAAHLILQPQVISTPLLSPNIIINNGQQQIPAPFLHPLQQALLIQQQQQQLLMQQKQKMLSPKELTYLSPKLPSIKSRTSDSGAAPSSPVVSAIQQRSAQTNRSPSGSSRSSTSATPPPPPPPIKETKFDSEANHVKLDKSTSKTFSTSYGSTSFNESMNKSKSLDYQDDDDMNSIKTSQLSNESKQNAEKCMKRHSERLFQESQLMFNELPDIQRYSTYYSPAFNDFTLGFYGAALDKQADASLDEAMKLVQQDDYRSKTTLTTARNDLNVIDSKLDVSSSWVDALNSVLGKIESLQDSSMTKTTPASSENKRESKLYANRKQKTIETNHIETKLNGDVKSINKKNCLLKHIPSNHVDVLHKENSEVR